MSQLEYPRSTSRCKPPWLRQIITPVFPNVIMLSLGGERLTPKVLDHYLHHDLGILPLLWCCFAHLLILNYPDHRQNSSVLQCTIQDPSPPPPLKISSQFIYNFLSNLHKQTNQRYQTHNLLCQGGNYVHVTVISVAVYVVVLLLDHAALQTVL